MSLYHFLSIVSLKYESKITFFIVSNIMCESLSFLTLFSYCFSSHLACVSKVWVNNHFFHCFFCVSLLLLFLVSPGLPAPGEFVPIFAEPRVSLVGVRPQSRNTRFLSFKKSFYILLTKYHYIQCNQSCNYDDRSTYNITF